MIKRTLYFGNPAYLSMRNAQLVVRLPEVANNETLTESFKKEAQATIPIEDIGVMILDHQQITLTQGLITALLDNNTAVITCDDKRMPTGLLLPLVGNMVQSERFKTQIEASAPLKKQLWQQTVATKIGNQAAVLKQQGAEVQNMLYWANSVKSGDVDNHEARAAAYYWKSLFNSLPIGEGWGGAMEFRRERDGLPPNNLLNYGYAILRAIVARSLVGSGLLPTLGIFHHNKYNAYCLADDIMEPYRPYVDQLVLQWIQQGKPIDELSKDAKAHLLGIATIDVQIDGDRSPLLVATQRTTASLTRCFEGEQRKILYPLIPGPSPSGRRAGDEGH